MSLWMRVETGQRTGSKIGLVHGWEEGGEGKRGRQTVTYGAMKLNMELIRLIAALGRTI